jgi:hypothetical protein
MPTKVLSHRNAHVTTQVARPLSAPKCPNRFTYLLKAWVIEVRAGGWYVTESYSWYYGEAPRWLGPYKDLSSANLAIASRLRAEAFNRHRRQVDTYRLQRGDPLYGLSRRKP